MPEAGVPLRLLLLVCSGGVGWGGVEGGGLDAEANRRPPPLRLVLLALSDLCVRAPPWLGVPLCTGVPPRGRSA